MFDNKIDKVKTQGELTLSHHTFTGASGFHFSNLNQSEKAVVYTIGLVILYLMIEKAYHYYKKIVSEHAIEAQNNMLPNYYTSLKFIDCKEFFEDEANFRKMGFKCLDD